jgi:hypothetical protein
MSAFPPHKSADSRPVSTSLALKYISNYLSSTASNPWLLPNATLQSTGPIGQSDSSSNLVIHNLKRVEAGLRGEWLAPSLDLEAEADPFAAPAAAAEEGWQDLDEYQREQSIEEGDGAPRTAHDEEDEQAPLDVHITGDPETKVVDKELRKKQKKEKAAQLKREKAEKARAQAAST